MSPAAPGKILSMDSTNALTAAHQPRPPAAGPKFGLRTRILAGLLTSPWVAGPFAAGVAMLPLSRFVGARIAVPLAALLICFALVQYVARLLLGFETLEKRARQEHAWQQLLERERTLPGIADSLDAGKNADAAKWLRSLRAVYWSFRNDRDAGKLPDVPLEAARQVDRLYDALVRRLVEVEEFSRVSGSVGGAVGEKVSRTLASDIEAIERGVGSLAEVILELRRLGHGEAGELARLHEILDSQLRIAKATDQRLHELIDDRQLME